MGGATSSFVSASNVCATQSTVLDCSSQASDSTVSSLEDIRRDLKQYREKSSLQVESIEARAERYIKRLTVPIEHLQLMVDSFVHELEVGLIEHQKNPYDWDSTKCSFKMLDTCVAKLPTGKEKGSYYALDFGGSTFRVVRAELHGKGKIETAKCEQSLIPAMAEGTLSAGLLSAQSTATEMFDLFALTVKQFLRDYRDDQKSQELMCGLTFSFPCSQRNINKAILINWTKGFATGRETDDPVEGLDVVELMNVAFQRNKVSMQCNSVLNDTVGTLLSCSYSMDYSKHPDCMVGLILGTGMNCCYYDETAPHYGYKGKIINVECGNFNRDLPRINVDCEIDFNTTAQRGYQQIEKMCSGAYLGEICRLCIVRILAKASPPMAWQAFSLSTECLARIVNDKSKELIVTYKVITDAWDTELPLEHLQIVKRVAQAVMDRSAALAAVLIVGCAKKTGRLQPAFGGVSVGIDGSLYTRNPQYRERLRSYINLILGEELGSLIHLLIADDGSGKGATVLAAILSN